MNIVFKRYFNEKDKRFIYFFEFQTFLIKGGGDTFIGLKRSERKCALFLKTITVFLMLVFWGENFSVYLLWESHDKKLIW